MDDLNVAKELINEISNNFKNLQNDYLKCVKERDIAIKFILNLTKEFENNHNVSSKKYLELIEEFKKDVTIMEEK